MSATLKQYTETSTASYQSGNAEAAKALAQHLVADVSWLSVDTTTSDTSSSFDQLLAVSWDSNTKLRIYNDSSYYYIEVRYKGSAVESSSSYYPKASIYSVGSTYTTQIVYGTNFLFVGRMAGGSQDATFSCFVGEVENYYDDHKATAYTSGLTNTNDYMWFWTADVKTGYTRSSSIVSAFPTPYTNWGAAGHLYGAVPQVIRYTGNSAIPIIGFVGGTDTLYRLYDNGNNMSVPVYDAVSIGGHSFFTVFYASTSTPTPYAFRIS